MRSSAGAELLSFVYKWQSPARRDADGSGSTGPRPAVDTRDTSVLSETGRCSRARYRRCFDSAEQARASLAANVGGQLRRRQPTRGPKSQVAAVFPIMRVLIGVRRCVAVVAILVTCLASRATSKSRVASARRRRRL